MDKSIMNNNQIVKVDYSASGLNNELYKFLMDDPSEVVEIELGEENIKDIISRDMLFKNNTPFTGYWKGFLSTSNTTETSIVISRKNFKNFSKELSKLVKDSCTSNLSKIDITDKVRELRTKYKRVSDSDFNIIMDNLFYRLLEKGVRVNGFLCKLVLNTEDIYITRELDIQYAVEFTSSKNIPVVNLFEINKDKTQAAGKITKGTCKYLSTFKYRDYDYIFEKRNIKEKDVICLDSSEFTDFYGFDNNYFVKITESRMNKWWNYDCCDKLIKYSLNLDNSSNEWNFSLLCWEDVLVESTWNKNYISEEITKQEFEAICKGRMDTRIAQDIMNMIELRELSEEEKNNVDIELSKVEKSIQDVINSNVHQIFKGALERYYGPTESFDNYTTEQLEKKLNSEFTGLDCGFLYFTPNDIDLLELYRKAQTLNLRSLSLKVDIPIGTQSTLLQGFMAAEVVKLVKSILNISIGYHTVLD